MRICGLGEFARYNHLIIIIIIIIIIIVIVIIHSPNGSYYEISLTKA